MKRIGLTGGIAAGKSTVSKMLQALGAYMIDADLLAREIVAPGSDALAEIAKTFGPQYLFPSGDLNRKALGAHVFAHPSELARLNAITHPRIAQRVHEEFDVAEKQNAPVAVLEAALLFEANWQEALEEVWLVDISEDLQRQRLATRDKLSPEEIDARLRAQMPLAHKRRLADRCIQNTGSLDETRHQVEQAWHALFA